MLVAKLQISLFGGAFIHMKSVIYYEKMSTEVT